MGRNGTEWEWGKRNGVSSYSLSFLLLFFLSCCANAQNGTKMERSRMDGCTRSDIDATTNKQIATETEQTIISTYKGFFLFSFFSSF